MPRQRSAVSASLDTNLDGQGLRIGIVASRFNEAITTRLYDGALNALLGHAVADADIETVWVPGALELPWTALRMARSRSHLDAIVTLGCVIRGETYHFEVVASGAVSGVQQASLAADLPIAFGVLTTYDEEQAMARSGGELGNSGADAAETAIYMANLRRHDLSAYFVPQSKLDRSTNG